MPASILPATDCLTPADLASIVASCGRFEADWKQGRPRRIEDELSAADERIRSQLFHDLLQLEFQLIYQAGRPASLDAYLARFPTGPTPSGRSSPRPCAVPAGARPQNDRGVGLLTAKATSCSANSGRAARPRLTWRTTAPCNAWWCSSATTASPPPAGARRCSTRAARWRGSAARSSRRATG